MNLKITFRILLFTAFLFSAFSSFSQEAADKYQSAINKADTYFEKGDYMNAKAAYQLASRLKPDESYPRERLQESLKLLRVQIEQRSEYKSKIKAADELFENKSYEKAIEFYEQASLIMPEKTYPEEKIKECNTLIEAEKTNRKQYKKLIAEADALFRNEKYNEAKDTYQQAQDYIDYEKYPEEQIAAIDKIINEMIQKQSDYEKAMSDAEEFIKRKDYENAVSSYEKAIELKPESTEAVIKLSELNDFLKIYERYTALVTEADDLYIGKMYEEAKAKYEEALKILPGEAYPKDIIKNIDAILENKAIADWEKYDELIAEADKLFDEKDYEKAMKTYKNALRFKPDGDYAQNKISAINDILDLRKSQEEAYKNAISKADELFDSGNYNAAREEYDNAHDIKPMEQYPKVKIDEIDVLLAEFQNKLGVYNSIIDGADKLFDIGDYKEALGQYKKALQVLPDKQYPKDKISLINDILDKANQDKQAYEKAIANADLHFENREYEDAKIDYITALEIFPEESYPKEQVNKVNDILVEIKAKEEDFAMAVNNADQLFQDEKYKAALMEYEAALEIKNDEYASQKIEEIAAKQALNEQYNNIIADADQLFDDNKYTEASIRYHEALQLKPEETYPAEQKRIIDQRLQEIAAQKEIDEQYSDLMASAQQYINNENFEEALLDFKKAAALKPDEKIPSEKIDELETIIKSIKTKNENYKNLIAEADILFGENKYQQALEKYKAAENILPDKDYAKYKVTETVSIIEEIERQKELDAQYSQAIKDADEYFNNKSYQLALASYNDAIQLKPAEQYPKDKIEEINIILQDIAEKERIMAAYNKAIEAADEAFNTEDYSQALEAFQKAKEIKPKEVYPEKRIIEINSILTQLAEEKERAYEVFVTRGDNFFNEGKYKSAMEAYTTAMNIKPEENYPRKRHSEAETMYLAEREAKEKEYRKAIGDADNFFNDKIYDRAIEKYEEALNILPEEKHPAEQIALMKKIINDNAIVDVNQDPIIIPSNNERKFNFDPMPVPVRKENYILIKANNPADHEFKIYMNFGENNTKNGGIAIRIPEMSEEKDFLVRIGGLYKWFSEDNNWISIYPEGGDVEVSLIRISKSN